MTTPNEQRPKSAALPFPLVAVKGKLIKVITHESVKGNVYEHVINLPVDDPYGFPPGLTVKSKSRLGNEGEEISVKARCSRRGYKANGVQRYNHEFWLHEGI